MEEELVHKSFWWQWANDQELPGKVGVITITGVDVHPGPAGSRTVLVLPHTVSCILHNKPLS